MNELPNVDVLVVGAGPVGLLTAIELTLNGASVAVLERLAAPSPVNKALGMGPLGAEALQRRGMAQAIVDAETRARAAMQVPSEAHTTTQKSSGPRYTGHFGGLTLIRADAQREPQRRSHMLPQQVVEAMLNGRARELGITVHRGCEVTGFTQSETGVELNWASRDAEGQLNCAYLVGCDGGRSAVRKLAGFHFPGTPGSMTMYNAVAEVDHPERLGPGGWRHTPGGMFSTFAGRLILLDFSGPPTDREAPVTAGEIERVLRQVSGADVRVTHMDSASRWTDNTRLVDTYRQGRVLLAGDAAHIHSPFGGQGMSLGLVDAANLGWKLAAVLRGDLPDSLLDTYTAERRPIAEAVLDNTLAQAAIMRPDAQASAMRALMVNLLEFDDVNRCVGEMVSGLFSRYDLGSEQDQVGRLLGDMSISTNEGEVSLYSLMQDGQGVLLDASKDRAASKLVQANASRTRCVPLTSGPSMLIRPDACLAWLDESGSIAGLEDALHLWFAAQKVVRA